MTLPVPVPATASLADGQGDAEPSAGGAHHSALVALVTVVLSLFTALASFQILQRQLDDRLQVASGRPATRSAARPTPTRTVPPTRPVPA